MEQEPCAFVVLGRPYDYYSYPSFFLPFLPLIFMYIRSQIGISESSLQSAHARRVCVYIHT